MTSVSVAQGRITGATAPSEWDVVYQQPRMSVSRADTTNGVLYFHPYGGTALSAFADTAAQRGLLEGLAKSSVVIATDMGLQPWGNSTCIARAVQAMNYGEANLGVTGPWTFVSVSMGNAGALATALAYPERVRGVAGILPLVDIADVSTRGLSGAVNAAYPPTYNDTTDGPTHSPVKFASSLNADLPVHLWTSSDDPVVYPATIDAFVAARPQTARTNVGALAHTFATITAATPEVITFVESLI